MSDIDKIKLIQNYEESCPVKLKGYVVSILGHKNCETWSFEELVDEFGYGYIMHMEDERKKITKTGD